MVELAYLLQKIVLKAHSFRGGWIAHFFINVSNFYANWDLNSLFALNIIYMKKDVV